MLLFQHLQGSPDVHLLLGALVYLGEVAQLAVDEGVGLVAVTGKDRIDVGFGFADLVPDNIFALLCNHELHEFIAVLLVQLLKDIACATLSSH